MKKTWVFIIVMILLFSIFLYVYYRKHDYSMEYYVDGYRVIEEFNIQNDHYYLKIQYNNDNYETYLNIGYNPKRKIVTSVKEIKENDLECIQLNDNILEYPICKQNGQYVSYYLTNNPSSKVEDTFNNISIYNLMDKTYLIWNYRGFYIINEDKITTINIFDQDTYLPYLITSIKDYLFIVDYDAKYEFNKIYLIDVDNSSSKKIDLDRYIAVDSYIMGIYKNSVYLLDKKEEQEYEINIKKGKVYKTSGKVLINNEWQKEDVSKLAKSPKYFSNDEIFKYELIDKKVYFNQNNILTKVSNLNVDSIVKYDNQSVFFISNGVLYYFDMKTGPKKIMEYSEWNFNYINCIFVYDNQK